MYPEDPDFQVHIVNTVAVDLMPAGSVFSSVEKKYAGNDAAITSNKFSATTEGWAVLLFLNDKGGSAEEMERFEVVRTFAWKRGDAANTSDPLDPFFPLERDCEIGTEIKAEAVDLHDEAACKSGYVLLQNAYYDGNGSQSPYDRANHSGPIFAVNTDLTGPIVDVKKDPQDPQDDLVVVWYKTSQVTGVCWPSTPVRYTAKWPAAAPEIKIASGEGSGSLDPLKYGTLDYMAVYAQDDREKSGYNPNEEHAAFFTASDGSPNPAVFPLRNDLNRTSTPDGKLGTSDPYVLLKYRDPLELKWKYEVFKVVLGTFSLDRKAGQEITPPYPVDQLCYGPCEESKKDEDDGISEESILKDKDSKFFARNAGPPNTPIIDVGVRYYYRLQQGFFYDTDGDNDPNATAGTCIPWFDVRALGAPKPKPVRVSYKISWPDSAPVLHLGETLLDAKNGLPNVANQCIVQIVYDEAKDNNSDAEPLARLLDPLKENEVQWPFANPEAGLNTTVPNLKPKKSLSTGRFVFTALPYHLQSRLTYDPTGWTDGKGSLKLRGVYNTGIGEPMLLLNTLTVREINAIDAIAGNADFNSMVIELSNKGISTYPDTPDSCYNAADGIHCLKDAEVKALSAGNAQANGHVTLAFNNDKDCTAPTMLNVIKVECPLYKGEIKSIESTTPFEEKVTLRHNGDFGGKIDDRYFQWKSLNADFSGIPKGPDTPGENWDLI